MPADSLELNLEDTLVPPGTNAAPSSPAEPSTPSQPAAGTPAPPNGQAAGPQPAGGVAAPAASLPPALLARAQSAGLPVDGITSHDKLAEFLLDRYTESRPYADYGRSALSSHQVANQGPQAVGGEQDDGEPEDVFDEDKFFSEAWSVPALSPGAKFALDHGAFDTNDKGMIVPAAGLEQIAFPYIKEINDYQQARAGQNEAFAANPVKFIAEKLLPYFEHKFSSRFTEQTNERFQQYEHQNFETQFIEQHKSWLYTPDGQAFTADGQKFKAAVAELREQGISDPQRLADYALKIAGINANSNAGQPVSPGPAPGATASPAPSTEGRVRDEQGRFLPAGTPAPAPTKQESFLDEARKKATASPSSGSYTEAAGEYNVANDGELENMFTNEFRKLQAA